MKEINKYCLQGCSRLKAVISSVMVEISLFPKCFCMFVSIYYLALCLSCRKKQRKAILSDLRVNMCTCVRERQKKDYV